MSRFLVNGASGFIGSALIEYLSRLGMEGVGVSRNRAIRVPDGWTAMEREEALENSPQSSCFPDVLIHLEVKHHVERITPSDLGEFERINVDGLNKWLAWCEKKGVQRVIYFSSVKAVANSKQVIDESASGPGNTPYGASKWRAEELVRKWASQDADRSVLILRPAVIYGPGNRANMYSFVKAIHRRRFFLVGRNENIKSLVSQQNVVSAVVYLAKRMEPGCSVYNLVDEESYSVATLVRMINEALGRDGSTLSMPVWVAKGCALAGDVLAGLLGRAPLTSQRLSALTETTAFSSEKLVQAGFVHPQTTREGLRGLVDWYLKEGND